MDGVWQCQPWCGAGEGGLCPQSTVNPDPATQEGEKIRGAGGIWDGAAFRRNGVG